MCLGSNGASINARMDETTLDLHLALRPAAGTPCAGAGAPSILVGDGLQYGDHMMEIQVSAGAAYEFRFYGGGITIGVGPQGWVYITIFSVDSSVSSLIRSSIDNGTVLDDLDPGWKYSTKRPSPGTGWDTSVDSRYHSSTVTFICPYGQGATASYLFTGASGIVLQGSVWQNTHAFRISLDDHIINMDSTGSWYEGPTVFFAKGNLDPAANHRFVIENYSSVDPDCPTARGGLCCTGFDSLVLLKSSSEQLREIFIQKNCTDVYL